MRFSGELGLDAGGAGVPGTLWPVVERSAEAVQTGPWWRRRGRASLDVCNIPPIGGIPSVERGGIAGGCDTFGPGGISRVKERTWRVRSTWPTVERKEQA